MDAMEKRRRFSANLVRLCEKAIKMGYDIVLCEVYLPSDVRSVTSKEHLHYIGLAAKLELYYYDKLVSDQSTYKQLADFWHSLDDKNRWGGEWQVNQNIYHFEKKI